MKYCDDFICLKKFINRWILLKITEDFFTFIHATPIFEKNPSFSSQPSALSILESLGVF